MHTPEPTVTQIFLISSLEIPIDDPEERVPGLDLDDRDSLTGDEASCVERWPDFVSLDHAEERGVDNSMALSRWFCFTSLECDFSTGPTPGELIARGHLAIALRITGIHSQEEDVVGVQLGTAHPPGCDPLDPESCRPALDGTLPAPDQEMVFQPLGPVVSMAVVGGRLRGEIGALQVPWAVVGVGPGDATIPFTVRGTQIDAHIDDQALEGSLGGRVTLEDMVELHFALLPESGLSRDEVRVGLEYSADLDPSASDPSACSAFSFGARVTAVRISVVD